MEKLPLTGIRVLALEFYWAGPLNTFLLANLGAEVIKVEHHLARGPATPTEVTARFRYMADWDCGERPWNRSGFMNQFTLGKRSLVLDLAHPKGKEMFLRLVKISDVVLDNYSTRVMPNFGLDYDALKEVNPEIIMVRQPGFGTIGPYKDYVAGGCPTGIHGGLPFYMGYEGEDPMRPESCIVDPWAGIHASLAVMIALWQRRKTGKGQFIDSGQCESVATVVGDKILGCQMNSNLPPRIGNHHYSMAPHNCYPCRDDNKWITIAISCDGEWDALCKAMGIPPWTRDERYSNQTGRKANHDELDRLISEWTAQHDHIALMHSLQEHGVPAGAVLDQRELMNDPQIKSRECYIDIEHPETGVRSYARCPWIMSRTPYLKERAPLMGEHNNYVLGELLGLSDQEIHELEKEKIISDRPLA